MLLDVSIAVSMHAPQIMRSPHRPLLSPFAFMGRFYAIPHAIKSWSKNVEEDAHASWSDLFFDLLYVAVAFSVGHLLEHSGPSVAGFFIVLAVFVNMTFMWIDKMVFFARFDVDDTVPIGTSGRKKNIPSYVRSIARVERSVPPTARRARRSTRSVDPQAHKLVDILEYITVGLTTVHIGGLAHGGHHHGAPTNTARIYIPRAYTYRAPIHTARLCIPHAYRAPANTAPTNTARLQILRAYKYRAPTNTAHLQIPRA